MDIFKRINHKNMKQERKRPLILIIAIAISTCLFTMVATFMVGLIDEAEKQTIRDNGNYYLRMNDKNNEYYNEFINDWDVEHIARLYRIRKCYLRTSGECSQTVCIMGCDKKDLSQLKVVIKKGKMPTNPKEIILPIEFEEELFEDGDIGKYINLTDKEIFYQQDNISYDNSLETKYKIVGYYQGDIASDDGEVNYVFSGYDSSTNKEDSIIFIKLKDGIFGTKINKFIKKYDLEEFEYKINDEVLLYKDIFKYSGMYAMYMLLFGIFYIVPLIASIIIISNAIMIALNNRRRQMGLLASVGATKKQLKKMMLHELMEAALFGIPLGIIIGNIVSKIFSLHFLKNIFEKMSDIKNYSSKLSIYAIIIILLFEIIAMLIAIIKPCIKIKRMNIIESSKEKEEINEKNLKKKGSWLSKRFGIEGMVADKYFKVNNKKYKRTMLGLAFSMVLFTVSICVCNLLEKALDDSVKLYDADITISSDYMDMADSDSAYKNSIRRYNKAKDSIKTVEGIKSKYFYCEDEDAEEIGIINKSDLNYYELNTIKERENVKSELPDKIGYFIKNIYVDEDMYKDIIKENNFDESKYVNNPNPKGILYNVRQKENSKKITPIITKKVNNILVEDSEAIYSRESEIGENYNANYNIWPILIWNDLEDHMVNDMMVTYMSKDKNENDIIEPLLTKNIEFDDIIDKKIDGLKNNDYDTIYLIYPDSMMEKVNEYAVVIKTDNYKEMKSSLQDWAKENIIDESNIVDKVEIKEVFGVIALCIKVFTYIFVIFMFIMAIANVLNIISTNFYYRRRDYAMIQSVGMSDKGLRKMLIYECLNYGIRAIMTGLPISIILSALIKLASGELKSYFAGSNILVNILTCIKNILPWGAVGILVLVIFAVVSLSMLYSIHEIKKESIIDTIKSTDI